MAERPFQRWQARAIEQKQTASSLILGLSGAALGFSLSLLSTSKGYIGSLESVLFHLQAAAQLLAIAAGVAFTLNRVRDFDLTSSIARVRAKNPSAAGLTLMRSRVRRWGRITRVLFATQILAFAAGVTVFLVFVALRYKEILYPH